MSGREPTIAACLIVRSAESTLERCLASVRPFVDEVNVYDTGSQDGTLDLLALLARAPGAPIRVEQGEWRDDFAWARERSFAMASEGVEWLLWLDADDEIAGGAELRRLAAEAPAEIDGFVLFYDCARDDAGNTTSQQWRERLVRRRAGYRWRGAVHEVLAPPDGAEARLARVPPERIRYVHRPAPARPSSQRNLDILLAERVWYERRGEPVPARTLLYLAYEHAFRGLFAEAAADLEAYLEQIGTDWSDERVHAVHRLATCRRLTGDTQTALGLELEAARHRPDWSETALGLAESYRALARWEEVEIWATKAHELSVPESVLVTNPAKLRVLPLLRLAEAHLMLGDRKAAGEAFTNALGLVRDSALEERLPDVEHGTPEEALRVVGEVAARYDEELQAVVRGLSVERGPPKERAAVAPTVSVPEDADELARLARRFPRLAGLDHSFREARYELAEAYAAYVAEISDPVFTISLELSALLLALCRHLRPATIADLGSGFSSYVFQLYAAESGGSIRVVSVDDSPFWLEKTRSFLAGMGLAEQELVLWDDFRHAVAPEFDLVSYDLGELTVRAETLEEAASLVAPAGLLVIDDFHIPAYRAHVERVLATEGMAGYSLRSLTLDAQGRFALAAAR
jgi:predicted O-methyltransferase YrrM